MNKLEKSKRFWTLVIFIPIAVALIWVLLGVFAYLLGYTSATASAYTLTIQPTTDDNFGDGYPGRETTNYGTGSLCIVSYSVGNARSFLRFDFSSLPDNATITNATLSLYFYTKGDDPIGRTYWAYELTETAWTELGSSWNNYDTGQAWASPGGDYITTDGASAVVPALENWIVFDVLALTEHFQSSHSEVANFLIRDGTEDSGAPAVAYFYSKDYHLGNPTLTPKLIITYTTPTPPAGEWEEDFEGFSTGTIDGQGNWTASAYPSVYQVSINNPYEGSKHLKIYSDVSGYRNAYPLFTADTEITTGVVEISFKIQMKRWEDYSIGIFSFWDSEYDFWAFLTYSEPDNSFLIRERSGGDIFGGKRLYLDDSWATIKLTLNLDTRHIYLDVNYKGEDWTQFSTHQGDMDGIKSLGFECFDCGIDLDDILHIAPEPPPDASVWGISPASATEITDLDTTLTIGYEELGLWDKLYVSFRHQQTGIFTEAKIYDIDEIGISGELEINLQDFNIEKNANWYLHAIGYPFGSLGFYVESFDLTDGNYYLVVNIEGYEEIFAMSDFDTWYDENAKFDEPTAMFSAIAGVFNPIFSVIGEFGNRINDYFNVEQSYGQGYDIGKTIAYFRYFVDQISMLLGEFPILLWLFIIILLLTGIFIFRLILKFIPFLGGS